MAAGSSSSTEWFGLGSVFQKKKRSVEEIHQQASELTTKISLILSSEDPIEEELQQQHLQECDSLIQDFNTYSEEDRKTASAAIESLKAQQEKLKAKKEIKKPLPIWSVARYKLPDVESVTKDIEALIKDLEAVLSPTEPVKSETQQALLTRCDEQINLSYYYDAKGRAALKEAINALKEKQQNLILKKIDPSSEVDAYQRIKQQIQEYQGSVKYFQARLDKTISLQGLENHIQGLKTLKSETSQAPEETRVRLIAEIDEIIHEFETLKVQVKQLSILDLKKFLQDLLVEIAADPLKINSDWVDQIKKTKQSLEKYQQQYRPTEEAPAPPSLSSLLREISELLVDCDFLTNYLNLKIEIAEWFRENASFFDSKGALNFEALKLSPAPASSSFSSPSVLPAEHKLTDVCQKVEEGIQPRLLALLNQNGAQGLLDPDIRNTIRYFTQVVSSCKSKLDEMAKQSENTRLRSRRARGPKRADAICEPRLIEKVVTFIQSRVKDFNPKQPELGDIHFQEIDWERSLTSFFEKITQALKADPSEEILQQLEALSGEIDGHLDEFQRFCAYDINLRTGDVYYMLKSLKIHQETEQEIHGAQQQYLRSLESDYLPKSMKVLRERLSEYKEALSKRKDEVALQLEEMKKVEKQEDSDAESKSLTRPNSPGLFDHALEAVATTGTNYIKSVCDKVLGANPQEGVEAESLEPAKKAFEDDGDWEVSDSYSPAPSSSSWAAAAVEQAVTAAYPDYSGFRIQGVKESLGISEISPATKTQESSSSFSFWSLVPGGFTDSEPPSLDVLPSELSKEEALPQFSDVPLSLRENIFKYHQGAKGLTSFSQAVSFIHTLNTARDLLANIQRESPGGAFLFNLQCAEINSQAINALLQGPTEEYESQFHQLYVAVLTEAERARALLMERRKNLEAQIKGELALTVIDRRIPSLPPQVELDAINQYMKENHMEELVVQAPSQSPPSEEGTDSVDSLSVSTSDAPKDPHSSPLSNPVSPMAATPFWSGKIEYAPEITFGCSLSTALICGGIGTAFVIVGIFSGGTTWALFGVAALAALFMLGGGGAWIHKTLESHSSPAPAFSA